jgi:uncharacterized coiled-coil DUF342 family protein
LIHTLLEEGKVQWGNDMEKVKEEFELTHETLVDLKKSLRDLSTGFDELKESIKTLSESYSGLDKLIDL